MRRLVRRKHRKHMDQSDIQYIVELLDDAVSEKDWDKILEATETLKEFLDGDEPLEEE
jgi:enolase